MSQKNLSRRAVIGAGVTSALAIGVGWAMWPRPGFDGSELSVSQAYEAAQAGKIILVDIRRPEEWESTGIAEGAHPVDMRRRDFVAALDALTDGEKTAPIALICARGVRSAWLSNRLTEAGYTNIVNVPEGMLGSNAGPGWIDSKLPLQDYAG